MQKRKNMCTLPIIVLLTIILAQSCDTTEPPKNESQLLLSQIEVSSTEAWLQLKTDNFAVPTDINLVQNSKLRKQITLTKKDTVLYVDSLLPNQTYTFQSIIQPTNQSSFTSNKVQVNTMDTTSHNFTWQTFAFGEYGAGSSRLFDVAIIDENNIWAVGEIFMNDSLGQPDPIAYNAVHWDGSEWKVKKISVLFRGNLITPPLEGVIAFSKEDIWFVGSLPIHGDGKNWKMYDLRTTVDENLSLSKTWGSNSQNIYFVGRGGSIAHYGGNAWQKIESGTKTIISDVWGITDPITFENEVYCAVSSFFLEPGKNDKKILKITSANVIEEIIWDTNRNVETVWTNNGIVMYAGGDGLFVNKTGKWNEITLGVNYYSNHVRGLALNNVFVVGGFGLVAHFNGINWRVYNELLISNGNYVSLRQTENNVVIVGSEGNKAKIIIGTQNL